MKTFKEFINEGFVDKALAGALTLGAVSAAAVGYRMMNPHQQPTQPTTIQPQIQPETKIETKAQIQQHQFGSEHAKRLYKSDEEG